MNREISAGAIIFRRKGTRTEYLLLKHETQKHRGEYWNFPKGHIEKGESEMEAARREIFEETGIKELKFVPGFRLPETYFFRRPGKKGWIFKIVIWRLAEVSQKIKPKISFEHEDFGWFLAKDVYKKLKYKEQKNIFKKAETFLQTAGLNVKAQRIFALVVKIPKGKVVVYQALAQILGVPKKARWIGFVLSKNTDPAIPCHRVVMANGGVGGYNKGVNNKISLLKREGIEVKDGRIDLKKYCK